MKRKKVVIFNDRQYPLNVQNCYVINTITHIGKSPVLHCDSSNNFHCLEILALTTSLAPWLLSSVLQVQWQIFESHSTSKGKWSISIQMIFFKCFRDVMLSVMPYACCFSNSFLPVLPSLNPTQKYII